MGETKLVIDLKRERLKEELLKEEPDPLIINRLKSSIKRHKKWKKKRNKLKRDLV